MGLKIVTNLVDDNDKYYVNILFFQGECLEVGAKCQQPCSHVREACGHLCQAACHPDQPCPKTACQAQVRALNSN